jgi:peroxiredoxin
MKRGFSNILKLLIICCALTLCSGFAWGENGKAVKPFTLKDINLKKVNLSDFRGKVVILNFFATWCPPCRTEIPELVKIFKENKEKGLVVVGISLDTDGPVQLVQRFVRDMKIPYPVLLGNMDLAESYTISGVPTTFILTREGKTHKRYDGLVPGSHVEKALKEIL